jgi:glycosyltransferase involved in cell wall biosynthesis
MTDPQVSVLIPAFRAEAQVIACLTSLLGGGNAAVPVELLVESDDGSDYAAAAALSPRVRVGRTGLVRSGVGAARGRALARARTPFVTYVDADDTVSSDYLPALLAAAGTGGAVAVTRVVAAGAEVARFGTPGGSLDFAALARHGASFRGLFPRAKCPVFENDLSQDILHMAEVLLRLGPLPVTEAVYTLTLAQGTVTAADDFSARVDAAYLRHIARLDKGYPGHRDLADAQAVFHAKRALNRRYTEEALPGESYYGFIARVAG